MIDFRSTVLLWNALLGCHGKKTEIEYNGNVNPIFSNDSFKQSNEISFDESQGSWKAAGLWNRIVSLFSERDDEKGKDGQLMTVDLDDMEVINVQKMSDDFNNVHGFFDFGEDDDGDRYGLVLDEGSKKKENACRLMGINPEEVELVGDQDGDEDNSMDEEVARGNGDGVDSIDSSHLEAEGLAVKLGDPQDGGVAYISCVPGIVQSFPFRLGADGRVNMSTISQYPVGKFDIRNFPELTALFPDSDEDHDISGIFSLEDGSLLLFVEANEEDGGAVIHLDVDGGLDLAVPVEASSADTYGCEDGFLYDGAIYCTLDSDDPTATFRVWDL